MKKINMAANKIINLKVSQLFLFIIFIIYICIFILVSCHHEPWLDEAQAWLIARDASYHDMIFVLPHYEGHPPVWWLVLSVPAKLNMPYELSLTVVSMMFSAASVYIILFKSPFCDAVKVSLPFSFFLFYQYGIIARPYCMLVLSFVLASWFYSNRDIKPFRFSGALLLMSMSSGFGIVIAGSIAVVWCLNIFGEYIHGKKVVNFLKSKTFYALLFLLLGAAFIIFLIIPAEDVFTWASFNYEIEKSNNPSFFIKGQLVGFIYMIFMIPADCLFSSDAGIYSSLISYCNEIPVIDCFSLLLLSSFVLIYIIDLTRRKGELIHFIIPYAALALFSVFVYFSKHHLGIASLFFIYIIWICKVSPDIKPSFIHLRVNNNLVIKKEAISFIVWGMYLVSSIVWSLFCSVSDIDRNYDYGRDIANYIKENKLEDKCIMVQWQINDDGDQSFTNTNAIYLPVSVLPYFDDNIFMNFNYGNPNDTFVWHKESDVETDYNIWSESVPDVLIGKAELEDVYGESLSMNEYQEEARFSASQFWKTTDSPYDVFIYKKITSAS